MSDSNKIVHQLRMNCDHDAANLIEQQQARIAELEVSEYADLELIANRQEKINELTATVERLRDQYERKDLVWFERSEVGNLDPEQIGFIDLNHVKREALIELAEHMTPEHGISHLYGGGDVRDYANIKYPSDKDGE